MNMVIVMHSININNIKSSISTLSKELNFSLHIKDEEKTTTFFIIVPTDKKKDNKSIENIVDSIKVFEKALGFEVVGFGTGPKSWTIVLEFNK